MAVGTPSELRPPAPTRPARASTADDGVKRLGRYQIIGRLATGGMAEVYLALAGELTGFRTLLVVKRILPHLASNSQFIRMFLDEARLASLLDHPNVVRIIEVGHDGEEYFLAMELVQGKPLSAVLRKATRERRPPSAALSAYIIAQAASGLGYAHALSDGDGLPLGVVHRDVSPQNILISFEGAVKMIDFGVARAFGRVAHTSPGGLKGKIEYMSPEQAGAEDVDHRADVFALGVVLWEALTGRRLYRRDTEIATMRAITDDPIPRPSEVASVPAELDAIVMRALRKRRDARFPTAFEMALALERYAFSCNGFSPFQVASYMKGLFAAEFLQWRKTATAALDMEVETRAATDARELDLSAEPLTHGPTMALGPSSNSGRVIGDAADGDREPSAAKSGSKKSRAREKSPVREPASIPSATVTVRPSRPDRLWLYGGLAALASITTAAAWVLARPPAASVGVMDRAPLAVEPTAAAAAAPASPIAAAPPAPPPTLAMPPTPPALPIPASLPVPAAPAAARMSAVPLAVAPSAVAAPQPQPGRAPIAGTRGSAHEIWPGTRAAATPSATGRAGTVSPPAGSAAVAAKPGVRRRRPTTTHARRDEASEPGPDETPPLTARQRADPFE